MKLRESVPALVTDQPQDHGPLVRFHWDGTSSRTKARPRLTPTTSPSSRLQGRQNS